MKESISKNMVYTEAEIAEFESLSKPLIKWLNDNSGHHSSIIITNDNVELFSSMAQIPEPQFVKD